MSMNGGIVLVQTSLVSVGSNVSAAAKSFQGGHGVLVLSATQFAPIVNLILKTPGGDVKMNSTALQANVCLSLDLPAGNYELHSATGSSVGIFAGLFPTP